MLCTQIGNYLLLSYDTWSLTKIQNSDFGQSSIENIVLMLLFYDNDAAIISQGARSEVPENNARAIVTASGGGGEIPTKC